MAVANIAIHESFSWCLPLSPRSGKKYISAQRNIAEAGGYLRKIM